MSNRDYLVEITEEIISPAVDSVDATEGIEIEIDSDTATANTAAVEVIEVEVAGPQGIAGPQNLVVGQTNTLTEPGLWVQTFPNGDFTLWIED